MTRAWSIRSRWPRRRLLASLGIAILGLTAVAPASAHPLGNFSINHFNGISIEADHIIVDHVLDMAEIPTFSERSLMDTDGDDEISASEMQSYAATACQETASALEATMDGRRIALEVRTADAALLPGQGAQTLRRECILEGAFAGSIEDGDANRFAFEDPTFAERRGWREIVVVGDGAAISDSDALTSSPSGRLTSFPNGLDSELLVQPTATWSATLGTGTAIGAARGSDEPTVAAASGDAAARSTVGEIGADFAALLDPDELTLPGLLLALTIAIVLGAAHALSPGHGKTVMAAYLVGSQGSIRMAVALGVMVTVSHTLGVLLLALLSVWASTLVPLERLYPVLGFASGAIIIALGAWLLRDRIRAMRASRRAAMVSPAHHHADAHVHGRDHDHGPHHHGHDAGQITDDAEGSDDGWHSHGLGRHRHVPPSGAPPGWRGLAALGLAGGMVPSVSALILLLASISAGRPEFGVVLTIAFGAGMAFVLVGIGVALVWGRGLLQRRPIRAMPKAGVWLPTVAAAFVLLAGVTMMGQAFLAFQAI